MTDLRTKAGREEEIIQKIIDSGGLSIFWATENQARACAIDRLIMKVKIKRKDCAHIFPFVEYEILEKIDVPH